MVSACAICWTHSAAASALGCWNTAAFVRDVHPHGQQQTGTGTAGSGFPYRWQCQTGKGLSSLWSATLTACPWYAFQGRHPPSDGWGHGEGGLQAGGGGSTHGTDWCQRQSPCSPSSCLASALQPWLCPPATAFSPLGFSLGESPGIAAAGMSQKNPPKVSRASLFGVQPSLSCVGNGTSCKLKSWNSNTQLKEHIRDKKQVIRD